MTKKLIVPLVSIISIISLIAFVAFSCAPSADAGSEPEEIAGSISYENITGAVESSISASPSNNIIPSAATVEYSIVPALPAGLMLIKNTGEIEGTPETESDETDNTDYVVTASGTGNYTGEIDSESFSITIGSALSDPMNISSNSSIGYVDINGSVNSSILVIPSSNIIPSVAVVTYSIDPELPDGLNFFTSTGKIEGTPEAESTTNHVVRVAATAPYTGSVESDPFTIVIVGEKSISGSVLNYPNITGIVGMPLSIINPTNNIPSDAKVEYSIVSSILPDGVMLNRSDGSIFGTPRAQATTARYTVRAAGMEGYTGMVTSNSFAITISNAQATDISVYSIAYESSTADVGDNVTLTPTRNTIPSDAMVTYSISLGRLPTGLEFDPENGGFEGMPTEAGRFDFRVTVTGERDFTGAVESDLFTIEINGIQITEGTLSYGSSGIGISSFVILTAPTFTIVPADATVTYSISPDSDMLPAELRLIPGSGVIEGTPTEAGVFNLIVIATANGNYRRSVQSAPFTIEITESTETMITGTSLSYADFDGVRGVAISSPSPLSPTLVIDQAEATVTYSISPDSDMLPAELRLIPGSGAIEGTPTEEGEFNLIVTATANGIYSGSVDSDEFTITIRIAISSTATYALNYARIDGIVGTPIDSSTSLPQVSIIPSGATVQYARQSNLPAGLSVNSSTGAIEGTPEVMTTGEFSRQTKAFGTGMYTGTVFSNEFRIKINPPIMQIGGSFNYPNTAFGDVGYPLTINPTAKNITPNGAEVRYEVSEGTLPPGLSVNSSTGAIEGTPGPVSGFDSQTFPSIRIRAVGIEDEGYSGVVTSTGHLTIVIRK